MSRYSSQQHKNFHVLFVRIMDEIQTAIQESTGKVPVGLLVSQPHNYDNLVGILTKEGFDGLCFSQNDEYWNLSILPEYFEKGEIFLKTRSCFSSYGKNPVSFQYSNQQNILLPYHNLADHLTQLEDLVLLQGYVSYGFLVADAGEDEEVRRLWSLVLSLENENYNTTGLAKCLYMDVFQHPVSFTPVYMLGKPDPIPLVLKGEWETAVVFAESDELHFS